MYKENTMIIGIQSDLYLTNYIRDMHKEIRNIYIEENKEDNISINNYIYYAYLNSS